MGRKDGAYRKKGVGREVGRRGRTPAGRIVRRKGGQEQVWHAAPIGVKREFRALDGPGGRPFLREFLRCREEALDGNEEIDVAVLGQFRGDVAVVDERGPDGDAARKPEGAAETSREPSIPTNGSKERRLFRTSVSNCSPITVSHPGRRSGETSRSEPSSTDFRRGSMNLR